MVVIGAGVSGIGAAWHLQDALPGRRRSPCSRRATRSVGPGTCSGSRGCAPTPTSRPTRTRSSRGRRPTRSRAATRSCEYLDETRRRVRPAASPSARSSRAARIEWSSDDSCWTVDAERADTDGADVRPALLVGDRDRPGTSATTAATCPSSPASTASTGGSCTRRTGPSDLEVDGRRVVVIGSGATAATMVPALADRGAHVTMLQRSPELLRLAADRRPDRRRAPPVPVAGARRSVDCGARTRRRRRCSTGCAVGSRRSCGACSCATSPADCPTASTSRATSRRRTRRGTSACASCPAATSSAPSRRVGADVVTDTIDDVHRAGGARSATGDELDGRRRDRGDRARGARARRRARWWSTARCMAPGERLVYKSVMLSDVPNLAYVFGYSERVVDA